MLMWKPVSIRFKVTQSMEAIVPAQWNALEGTDIPFLRYEFLSALERYGCLGSHVGWFPRYLLAEDVQGRLVGAMPLYLKYNSFGEFVFDWSWAEAWEQAGRSYYPKLVVAIPFSPITSPRLLLQPGTDETVAKAFIEAAVTLARENGVSSLHWLFPSQEDANRLVHCGLLLREGYQFHWHNRGYRDFSEFLEALTSKRRKEIKRERRQVEAQGVEIKIIHGHEASETEWRAMERFYRVTFNAKGNFPALTLPFFQSLGQTLGQTLVLVLASYSGRIIAGAFYMQSKDTLYGRYWGSTAPFPALHFELCYYRGLEYCIEHGLQRFEPGAQGEHKLSRGFLPQVTWSAHWLNDPSFRAAVTDFLSQERQEVRGKMLELRKHSPYRQG
jgi:uncharacterized protein